MDPLSRRILTAILVLAALFFLLLIISCSPERRFSKLVKKFPHLIETKMDTVFQDRVVIEEIPIPIYTDSIRFDSLLTEFYTIREDYYRITNTGFINERSEIQIEQLKARVDLLKRELRKGAFVETDGYYVSQDSTLSFNYSFNPSASIPLKIADVKTKDRVITQTKTIKLKPTNKEAFSQLWWVWLIVVVIIIAIIFSKIF